VFVPTALVIHVAMAPAHDILRLVAPAHDSLRLLNALFAAIEKPTDARPAGCTTAAWRERSARYVTCRAQASSAT